MADRRGFDPAEARRVGDGRVYTGRQAVTTGLIDAIGGEKEAISWLAEEEGIDKDIKIRDWKPARDLESLGLFERAALGVARLIGAEGAMATLLGNMDAAKRLQLDGLVSVWHAPLDKAD